MITEEGLKVENKDTIVARLNEDLLEDYPSLNLHVSSPFYQRNYTISQIIAMLWEVTQRSIDMMFYESASGIFLDYNLERMGESRMTPRPSIVECSISGELSESAIITVAGNPSIRFIRSELDSGLYKFVTTENVKTGLFIDSRLLVDDKSAIITVVNIIQEGHEYEKDEDVKRRIRNKARSRGFGTRLALKSGLQDLPGVSRVEVYVNNMHFYDENGVPPGYWHVIVSGGEDIVIADYIDINTHDGQLLYGKFYETSSGGYVRFSRNLEIIIYIKIYLRIDNKFDLSDEEIKQKVIAKAREIKEGEDLVCDPYLESVITRSGIYRLEIEAKRSGGDYGNVVPLGYLDMPVFSEDRIEIIRENKIDSTGIDVWVKLELDAKSTKLDLIKRTVLSINGKIEPGSQLKGVYLLTVLMTSVDFRKFNVGLKKDVASDYEQYIDLDDDEVPVFAYERIEVDFI